MDYVTKEEFNRLVQAFNNLVYEINQCDLKRVVRVEEYMSEDEFEFKDEETSEEPDKDKLDF